MLCAVVDLTLFAISMSGSLMKAQAGPTEKFNDFKTHMFWAVLVIAVLPSLLVLWEGLHPAVRAPLRLLIVPVELALAALIAAIADEMLFLPGIPEYQARLTLGVAGALLLAVPFAVDLSNQFQRWKSSVCMAAGTLLAWMGGNVLFCPLGLVQPGTGLELFASFATVIAQALWQAACRAFFSLWPFVPGVEGAVASLIGYAVVSWFLEGTPLVRATAGYSVCVCVLAPVVLWSAPFWSTGLPPGVEGLGVPVLWILGVMLIHLYFRVALDQGASLWLFLTCAACTVTWSEVVGFDFASDLCYLNFKPIFILVWACGMVYKVLIPTCLRIGRDFMAYIPRRPLPPRSPRRVGFPIPLGDPDAPGPRAQ